MKKSMKRKIQSLFKRQVPFPIVIIVLPLAACAAYLAGQQTVSPPASTAGTIHSPTEQIRLQNYEFARPLVLVGMRDEDPRLDTLKRNVAAYVGARIQEGVLQTASVYLRIGGSWAAINDQERYSPGSLLKLPLLIHFLKESEKNPSILGRSLYFPSHFEVSRRPEIVEHPLEPGRSYRVEELLRRMIVYSDNDATILLNNLAGPGADNDVYDALHLTRPDWTSTDYFLTVEEYSRFFRVLYNATYLEPPLSDYALRLLSESSFRGGLVRPIDPAIKVAHKFGERGSNGVSEFHEMGIVYHGHQPYLLGVMTKGRDLAELQNVVADISGIVYSGLSKSSIVF